MNVANSTYCIGIKVKIKQYVGLRTQNMRLILTCKLDWKYIRYWAFAKSSNNKTFSRFYNQTSWHSVQISYVE